MLSLCGGGTQGGKRSMIDDIAVAALCMFSSSPIGSAASPSSRWSLSRSLAPLLTHYRMGLVRGHRKSVCGAGSVVDSARGRDGPVDDWRLHLWYRFAAPSFRWMDAMGAGLGAVHADRFWPGADRGSAPARPCRARSGGPVAPAFARPSRLTHRSELDYPRSRRWRARRSPRRSLSSATSRFANRARTNMRNILALQCRTRCDREVVSSDTTSTAVARRRSNTEERSMRVAEHRIDPQDSPNVRSARSPPRSPARQACSEQRSWTIAAAATRLCARRLSRSRSIWTN